MNSRMQRYSNMEANNTSGSRVSKNQNLYDDINSQTLSRIKTNDNFRILEESPKEIDIEKIKNYISSLNEKKEEKKKIILNTVTNNENSEESEEPKIYDINSIIERAKEKKESSYEEDKYKKLHNTQYDILRKIEMYDSIKPEKEEPKFNTEERTLIDLINTISVKKEENDLLSELMGGSDNTIITNPINEELSNEEVKVEKIDVPESEPSSLTNIDKSFYTNSMNFSKEDFEGLNELEKEVTKNNFFVKFIIFVLIIVFIGTIVVILNYILDLGLF